MGTGGGSEEKIEKRAIKRRKGRKRKIMDINQGMEEMHAVA
jgi:hypothetical protein